MAKPYKRLNNRNVAVFITDFGYARIARVNGYTGQHSEVSTARLNPGCTVKIMPDEGNRPSKSLIIGRGVVTAAAREDRIPEELARWLRADLCLTVAEYATECARLDRLSAKQHANRRA